MTVPEAPNTDRANLDRRTLLLALATAIAAPGFALAAGTDRSWVIGTQILAGTRPRNPDFLAAALDAFQGVFGAEASDRLLDAVLQRDAARITEPFDDQRLEEAARYLVGILYTGDFPSGRGADVPLGFQQALAWQVLGFTKAPSVCGPGFGSWNAPPSAAS